MTVEGYEWVASLQDVPRGKVLVLDVQGREVLLCHTSEGVYAVDNTCTHAAARLCEGKLKGHRLFCPLHSGSFDVRDGSVLSRPALVALRVYPIEVREQDIYLQAAED